MSGVSCSLCRKQKKTYNDARQLDKRRNVNFEQSRQAVLIAMDEWLMRSSLELPGMQ